MKEVLLESIRVVGNNKLVFWCIISLTTLPLSFLLFTLQISTHTLRSHIYHLQSLSLVTPTLIESRHVLHESRQDAILLLRIRFLFYFLSLPLSLSAAVSSIHATHSAVLQRNPVTVNSTAAAVRDRWKRTFLTAIFVYVILLAFAIVPPVIASLFMSPESRFFIRAIGSVVEVYLMAVLGLGLVVSVVEEDEERFVCMEAIIVGSDLMRGRRLFFGWFISGMFVLVSGFINRRVEFLLEEDSGIIGILDKTVIICSYGLLVLFSYVVTTVFYFHAKKPKLALIPRDPDDEDDQHHANCVSLSSYS